MEVLRCNNLSFSYENKVVLKDIDLSIEKGKITGLLGGNGAGKSTLFLNLNGILRPQWGDIYLNNVRIEGNKRGRNLLRNSVGIVFQNPDDQIISSNVFDDISFGLLNQGICSSEIKSRVDKIIQDLSLMEIVNTPVHKLSYGQRKKVAIAGVLVMKPSVIILDEPTAGLDPSGVSEMCSLLKSLASDYRIGVLISTHEMDLVPNICSRIYILKNGVITYSGDVNGAINNPSIIREAGLRLPRLSHLMEVMNKRDGLNLNIEASTISRARKEVLSLINSSCSMEIIKDNKKLRKGYTTGSCAAAASKASGIMLLSGRKVESVRILTPKGIPLDLKVYNQTIGKDYAQCSIIKDGGDDPDVTTGLHIYSRVSRGSNGKILIDGGEGVGRVLKDGLSIEKGSAAINPVPREMIKSSLIEVSEEEEYRGGFNVIISAKGGEEVALKTFNPRLGIEGGISILGTTGIVEPMSETAIIESFKAEMRIHRANGYKTLVIAPGNYGQVFSREEYNLDETRVIKVSNFIGEALDYGCYLGFKRIVLLGHMGKMVKLAGGIMNTHSKVGDCRMELISLYTLLEGGEIRLSEKILSSTTTDEAYKYLQTSRLCEPVIKRLGKNIDFHLKNRINNQTCIEFIVFSNKYGILFKTNKVDSILKKLD
ncbi:MAG: cobalt-precorrin-5B (C(1))-methyltransferase CbiD [Clostridium sp.]